MLSTFIISVFFIVFAMLGYPLSLKLLDFIFKPAKIKKDYSLEPKVTLMIVAHNEEKVIEDKLNNAISLNYPKEKYQIIVTSDLSNDRTNEIVEDFIKKHSDYNIILHKTIEHKGKTNAQNEGQKLANGEILVMTDANSIIEKNAIKELVSSFSNDDIAYVTGRLAYIKDINNLTNKSENMYWNLDLTLRDIESRFYSVTAGNGALYACKNKDYIDLEPIRCHDGSMPYNYVLLGKRAIFNPDAIAYEKTGNNNEDEFKRKIRMSRLGLRIFRYFFAVLTCKKKIGLYKYFYFGHRFCRRTLWLAHIIAFISCFIAMLQGKKWGKFFTVLQAMLGIIAYISLKFRIKNKLIRMIGYYAMTVFAQIVGIKNDYTGKSKPTWEKAESTR